jgi:hypothetical protein
MPSERVALAGHVRRKPHRVAISHAEVGRAFSDDRVQVHGHALAFARDTPCVE